MTSLRKTVMGYVTGLLIFVGVAAAVTSYYFVKYEVNSFQDNALHEVAMTAGMVFRQDIEPRIDAELEDQLVIQIWNEAQQPLHRSGPVVDIPLQPELGYSDVTAGGERWRVFRSRDAGHAIQVSQRWSAREEVAAYAAAGAAVPLAVSIPIAWLLIWWAVKRVLSGLGNLSSEIGARSADAKDALGLTGIPVEVVPLITAMNSLIERHQLALETQRRFVSDAAHELRTPLAALQIQIDNLRARELSGPSRETAQDLLDGIRRASYSVNQLMTLVRADASIESEAEVVDAQALISLIAAGFAPVAEAKGVTLTVQSQPDCALHVRADDLRLIVSNLIDNAVRYTREGGSVSVGTRRLDDSLVIEVLDTGCGIPESAIPHLYDRFFRAAPVDIDGTGLGLAIAKSAADRSGFTLTIANRPGVRGVSGQVAIRLDQGDVAALSPKAA
ncbi:two-component sensor histidine kinase [Tardiphaga alba]|uniref:histidine kinase n=1 Tax=Tardiphaga alba TaxID=340268 RepID=A0ABX8ACU7_9BRAD|nr:ATP-binding protein [Tardiphaga alba]QUS41573.1 two-component sensor histidine kinase [Tardiphaga alba]